MTTSPIVMAPERTPRADITSIAVSPTENIALCARGGRARSASPALVPDSLKASTLSSTAYINGLKGAKDEHFSSSEWLSGWRHELEFKTGLVFYICIFGL